MELNVDSTFLRIASAGVLVPALELRARRGDEVRDWKDHYSKNALYQRLVIK